MPLFVVATPIGNLQDLSPRALKVLTSASVVLCEDTRHTRKLFSALGLETPEMWSCHSHNELERLPQICALLEEGKAVALVSDAGTPAVSDPGGRLVEQILESNYSVHVVPGPSSVAAALSVSGLPASPHLFLGFPPRKPGALRPFLMDGLALECTMVILESGKRLGRLVKLLKELAPERMGVMCRELTKFHEEVKRARLIDWEAEPVRGEVVFLVGPGSAPDRAHRPTHLEGTSLKAVASVLAERWGCSKRVAYQRLLDLEKES